MVSKTEIHSHLWPGTFVADATLAGLVKEVRRALRQDGEAEFIRTAHRVGYAFVPPAESSLTGTPAAVTHWLVSGTRRITLQEGVNVIGRDPEATVWLDVSGVSRRHAQISVENGAATLEDLGSKNGTLHADRPVRGPVTLHDADRIQVATELLVFRVSGSGVSTTTQPIRSSSSESKSD